MDFISYVLENMSNFGIVSYIFRELGWLLVKLFVYLCNACEQLYKTVFSMIGFLFSSKIMNYIQDKLFPFIAVLFALSIIILGYNLIVKTDDKERKKKLTTFGENLILFAIILFGLPFIFTGKSVWSDGTVSIGDAKYTYSENNSYLIGTIRGSLVKDENGVTSLSGGILEALKWKESDNTTAEDTVAEYIDDYLYMYEKYAEKYAGDSSFESKVGDLKRNQFSGKLSALSIDSINEDIDEDTVDDVLKEDYELKFSDIENTEDTGEDNESALHKFGWNLLTLGLYNIWKDDQEVYSLTTKNSDGETMIIFEEADTDLSEYLFRKTHEEVLSDDGSSITDASKEIDKFFDFLEETPYRYSVDWFPLFLSLISLILVFFGLSFKTASLIWNLAFNHILVYIFAAGDMAGGQKTREILKSMFSILITIIFCYVNLQVFLIGQAYLKDIKYTGNFGSITHSIILLFFAIACINGPNILIKLFGVSGSSLAGALIGGKIAKSGANAVKNTVGSAVGLGAGIAGYAQGVKSEKANSKSNALGGGFGNDSNKNTENNQGNSPFDNTYANNDEQTNKGNDVSLIDGENNSDNFGGYSDSESTDVNNGTASSRDSSTDNRLAGGRNIGSYNGNINNDVEVSDSDLHRNGSIYDQCKELGMSNEDATQTLKELTSNDGNKKDEAYKRIGSYVDYDKAIGKEENGGLGFTDKKMAQLLEGDKNIGKDYSSKAIGKAYADKMLNKAEKEATKNQFNHGSPYRENINDVTTDSDIAKTVFNSRSGAFTGSSNVGSASNSRVTSGLNNSSNVTNINSANVSSPSNSNIGLTNPKNSTNRISNAIYGSSMASVLMPNLSRKYKCGREAGYNHYNNKAQEKAIIFDNDVLERNKQMADDIYKNNAVYNVTRSNAIENQANVSQDI